MSTAVPGPDDKPRCRWCLAAPDFLAYHDGEWGFPVADDHRLFEKLSLECFQSGLSWRTILAKRENFRLGFHQSRVSLRPHGLNPYYRNEVMDAGSSPA